MLLARDDRRGAEAAARLARVVRGKAHEAADDAGGDGDEEAERGQELAGDHVREEDGPAPVYVPCTRHTREDGRVRACTGGVHARS